MGRRATGTVLVACGLLFARVGHADPALPDRAHDVLEDERYQNWLPGFEGSGRAEASGLGRRGGASNGASGGGGPGGIGRPGGDRGGGSGDSRGSRGPGGAAGGAGGGSASGDGGPSGGGSASGGGGGDASAAGSGSDSARASGASHTPPPRSTTATGDQRRGASQDRPRRSPAPLPSREPVDVVPPTGATVLQSVIFVLIAALVAVGFFALLRLLPGWRRAEAEPAPLLTERIEVPEPRGMPHDLASDGHYGEAVHAMLLLALKRLAERGGAAARHSTTSREILDHETLDTDARERLEVLVANVEAWWFGGRELTRADYDRCAAAWTALRPQLDRP